MLDVINLKQKHKIFSKPRKEVEHRTAHRSECSVLNVFETQREAFDFDLIFSTPVVVSMIQGKKIMHLRDQEPFEFVPGETIAMPQSESMTIDFPEANRAHPTQCMALEICPDIISDVADWMNEVAAKMDAGDWAWTSTNYHLNNSPGLSRTINELFSTMIDRDYSLRDLRAANITRELVGQLLRTQARGFLLENANQLHTSNRLAFAIHYIRTHITEDISVDALAEKACLSRAQFFRAFKNELNMTPVQFINGERVLRACHMLKKGNVPLTDVFVYAGFNSQSYFNRIFKSCTGMTPAEWRQEYFKKRFLA